MRLPIWLLVVAIFFVSGSGANGQSTESRITPVVGEASSASVGSPMMEEYRYVGTEGVIIDQAVLANWGSAERVDLPTGAGLFIIRERRLKACQTRETFAHLPGAPSVWRNCLVDTNEDGRFDKVIYSEDGFSKTIDPPAPYHRGIVEVSGDASQNFRRLLIYSGVSGGALRLSYREFSNDMARPAFTEDLTIPLDSTYPQEIAVKSYRFSIEAIDGIGIHYKRTQ